MYHHQKPPEIVSSQDSLLVRFSTDGTMTARGFSIAYVAVDPFDGDGESLIGGANGDSYSDEELSTPFPGSLRSMYVSARGGGGGGGGGFGSGGGSSGSNSAEERGGHQRGYGRVGGFDSIFGGVLPLTNGGGGVGGGIGGGSTSSGGPDNDADVDNGSIDAETEDEEDYKDFMRFKTQVEERPANRLSAEQFD